MNPAAGKVFLHCHFGRCCKCTACL